MNLTFEQFAGLAKRHSLIPLFDEMPADLDTPVSAFLKLKSGRYDFLFESVVGGEKWARYSFLGTNPKKIYFLKNDRLMARDPVSGNETECGYDGNPLFYFREWLKALSPYEDPQLPRFFGGLVGYLGYGMVRYFDGIGLTGEGPYEAPDLYFLLTDTAVIFDNFGQVMKIVCAVEIPENAVSENDLRKLYDEASQKISEVRAKLRRPLGAESIQEKNSPPKNSPQMLFSEAEFCRNVETAQEYIKAGDVFQVVLSNRFTLAAPDVDPFEVYRRLRRLNPSPYMFYLTVNGSHVVGASPEILVRLEEGKVEVRPIAGTRRRGGDEKEDLALEAELLADPKEISEHIMLVDLGRNDVGRVAEIGTVRVEEERVVERYSHVMHLVSHVSGKLASGKDVFDVITAAFPAGTLSGAPKIRAMEIINELEGTGRGLYGGAIGYISFTGNTDLAIAIRTAVFHEGKAFVQAGAGIVHSSVPASEHQECVNKAKGILGAI